MPTVKKPGANEYKMQKLLWSAYIATLGRVNQHPNQCKRSYTKNEEFTVTLWPSPYSYFIENTNLTYIYSTEDPKPKFCKRTLGGF